MGLSNFLSHFKGLTVLRGYLSQVQNHLGISLCCKAKKNLNLFVVFINDILPKVV